MNPDAIGRDPACPSACLLGFKTTKKSVWQSGGTSDLDQRQLTLRPASSMHGENDEVSLADRTAAKSFGVIMKSGAFAADCAFEPMAFVVAADQD